MIVQDFMIKKFPTLTVQHTLQDALDHFATMTAHIIPIVNEHSKLTGILTKNKVIQTLVEQYPTSHPIASFIIQDPIFLFPEQSIDKTRNLLLMHKIGHAPVVNEIMEPIGILSTFQILFAYNLGYGLSQEWEAKLRSVIELAYDGIMLINQQAEITMVNDGFCELYNVRESDLLGQFVGDIYPELAIQDVLQTGVKLDNIATLIAETQCLITILPLKDEQQIVGAVCKITYRGLKQLQEALKKVNALEQQLTYYQKELHDRRGTKYSFVDIIGDSAAIQCAKKEASAASRSLSTVLLIGESGTGKELFAHGIHASSSQSGLFVQVNCAAVPAELLESEFFGYAEGAFTGAKKGGKKGKFELAQNGTLFLDEIGDMPLALQTKLLRVLQEKEFEPIGSNRLIKLNTKIIAATNQNLEQLIAEGKFREDLYYRLNVMRIVIPPLRDRIEDIPKITESIITRLSQSGFYLKGVTHSALTTLLTYNWPGNIRELHNLLERAANLTEDGYIDGQHLPTPLASNLVQAAPLPEVSNSPPINTPASYWKAINLTEKELIMNALAETNGNKAQASRLLGISRTWLYTKLKKYNIE